METNNELFNIYYINFPKVYEVKMTMSNIEIKDFSVEEGNGINKEDSVNAKIGGNIFSFMNASLGGKIKDSKSISNKIVETFEVKTTKSVILKDVINRAKTFDNIENLCIGDLVRFDDVLLDLSNENELKIVKLFMSGSVPMQQNTPDLQGVDFEKLFNAMFKDYAYKLVGNNTKFDLPVLAKIPISFENEFESSYSVEDVLIGAVSLVGIYKGQIKGNKIRTSFDYYAQLGELSSSNSTNQPYSEIKQSQIVLPESTNIPETGFNITNNEFNESDYHYIDLLAVVQKVNVQNANNEE